MIGPTPNSSVRVVGEGCLGRGDGGTDAAVGLLELHVEALHVGEQFDPRSCLACSTGVAGWTRSRSAAASEALSSVAIPPGESSMTRLWRRHTIRVRWLPMSMLGLASSRSTWA